MEAIALIADIHANLLAAEAVISDIHKKHKPDRIVSLGDQVNLGPAPRDTLRLLRSESVTCLHGNHEGYILSAMNDDPKYAGANFASLRFNASRLKPEEITFQKRLDIEGVTLCHALPEDDRFPVYDPTLALPRLETMSFPEKTHIICGHGHNPIHYTLPNLTLDVIGSTGCMDDGVPGMALYAMLYLSPGHATLEPCITWYNPTPLKELYISSGFAEACPIMAHITCLQQQHNFDYLLPFVTLARKLAAEKNETDISRETWAQADTLFDWPDHVSTAAFWRALSSNDHA